MTTPLARTDLNLLTVFRALDEARSVTRAAKTLGVSQPALSQALRRLRELFDDAMFVHTPRGLVLTPRAESLAPAIREMLGRLEREVLGTGEFRPEALRRTFRIRTTDFLEAVLVPSLLDRFATQAPLVSLSVSPTEFGLPKEALSSGACDLAIAGFFGELPDGFYQQRLFADGFSCAVRRGHPRLDGVRRLTLDAYCGEPHVLIAPGGDLRGVVDRALERLRKKRRVVVGASGFLIGAYIAARTDAILTAPSRLLSLMADRLELVLFEPPLPLAEIKIVQAWHARNHDDPGHKWLREMVRDVAARSD
jgi:DNA-binding transcriptional LysR family regulator